MTSLLVIGKTSKGCLEAQLLSNYIDVTDAIRISQDV